MALEIRPSDSLNVPSFATRSGSATQDDLDLIRDAGPLFISSVTGGPVTYAGSSGRSLTDIQDGTLISVVLPVDCDANPTLNVDSIGAWPLSKSNGEAFAEDELQANTIYVFVKRSLNQWYFSNWRPAGPTTAQFTTLNNEIINAREGSGSLDLRLDADGVAIEASLDLIRDAGPLLIQSVTGGPVTYDGSSGRSLAAIPNGTFISVVFNVDCGDSPTLNIDTLGAWPLSKSNGAAFAEDELQANTIYVFVKRSINQWYFSNWRPAGPTTAQFTTLNNEIINAREGSGSLDLRLDQIRDAGPLLIQSVTGGPITYAGSSGRSLTFVQSGTFISVVLPVDCGANPTLNVDSIGAWPLVKSNGAAFAANDLRAGTVYVFLRRGDGRWIFANWWTAGPTTDQFTTLQNEVITARQGEVSLDVSLDLRFDALQAEIDIDVDARLEFRPGDRPDLFTEDLLGASGNTDPLVGISSAFDTDGRTLRVVGARIIAARRTFRIESGHAYKVRGIVRRRINPADPSNDAVALKIQWLNTSQTVSVGTTVILNENDLLTGNGRFEISGIVALTAGAGIGFVAPAGALYGRVYIQTFGLATTDVEVIEFLDITNASIVDTGDVALNARITALESGDLAARLDAAEAEITGSEIARFKTRSAAVAAAAAGTIAASVDLVEVLADTLDTDGTFATYSREVASSGTDWFEDDDGSFWVRVPEAIVSTGGTIARRLQDIFADWIRPDQYELGSDPDDTLSLMRAAEKAQDRAIPLWIPSKSGGYSHDMMRMEGPIRIMLDHDAVLRLKNSATPYGGIILSNLYLEASGSSVIGGVIDANRANQNKAAYNLAGGSATRFFYGIWARGTVGDHISDVVIRTRIKNAMDFGFNAHYVDDLDLDVIVEDSGAGVSIINCDDAVVRRVVARRIDNDGALLYPHAFDIQESVVTGGNITVSDQSGYDLAAASTTRSDWFSGLTVIKSRVNLHGINLSALADNAMTKSVGVSLVEATGSFIGGLHVEGYTSVHLELVSCADTTIDDFTLDGRYQRSSLWPTEAGEGWHGINGGFYLPSASRALRPNVNCTLSNGRIKRMLGPGGRDFLGSDITCNNVKAYGCRDGHLEESNNTNPSFLTPEQQLSRRNRHINCDYSWNERYGFWDMGGQDLHLINTSMNNNGQALSAAGGALRSTGTFAGPSAGYRGADGAVAVSRSRTILRGCTTQDTQTNVAFNGSVSPAAPTIISLLNPTLYTEGQTIKLEGCGAAGSDLITQILSINLDELTIADAVETFPVVADTGTISTSGTTVTGSSTVFSTAIQGRTWIKVGSDYRLINRVTSDTAATLETAFPSNLSGSSYDIVKFNVEQIQSQDHGILTEGVANDSTLVVDGHSFGVGNVTADHSLAFVIPISLANRQAQHLGPPVNLTIASGVVTVDEYHSDYAIETEGGAAADDLTSISGGKIGQIIHLRSFSSAHVVTIADGTPLFIHGVCVLSSLTDSITLKNIGGSQWQELARGRASKRYLEASATFDPASLANGDGETTTITVTGAQLGDFAEASFSLNLLGLTLTAWVSATNTVSVRLQNGTGGVVNVGSGTLRVRVTQPGA